MSSIGINCSVTVEISPLEN
uniref:Uncharacterized protein n=1 Tax=Anguilla anguilla TaxID=7936 RepID=A0A0E9V007_ANGAN